MSASSIQKLSNVSFYRGESFRERLPIINPDDTPKNLTSATVEWALVDGADALLFPRYTLGAGVAFEAGDPTLGVLLITVPDTTTDDIAPGVYWQEFRVTDQVEDVQVYRGLVSVSKAVLWQP